MIRRTHPFVRRFPTQYISSNSSPVCETCVNACGLVVRRWQRHCIGTGLDKYIDQVSDKIKLRVVWGMRMGFWPMVTAEEDYWAVRNTGKRSKYYGRGGGVNSTPSFIC